MSQEPDESLPRRGRQEYFWFAMTLVALMFCTAIKDTKNLADISFASSQGSGAR